MEDTCERGIDFYSDIAQLAIELTRMATATTHQQRCELAADILARVAQVKSVLETNPLYVREPPSNLDEAKILATMLPSALAYSLMRLQAT